MDRDKVLEQAWAAASAVGLEHKRCSEMAEILSAALSPPDADLGPVNLNDEEPDILPKRRPPDAEGLIEKLRSDTGWYAYALNSEERKALNRARRVTRDAIIEIIRSHFGEEQ